MLVSYTRFAGPGSEPIPELASSTFSAAKHIGDGLAQPKRSDLRNATAWFENLAEVTRACSMFAKPSQPRHP